MLKSLGLASFCLLAAGCSSGRPVDPLAAENAELHAQIDAMKHHPSVLERAKLQSDKARVEQKKK
ncbi:MAG TPA: hypothetical protein VK485_10285 [Sphingomicrobium sp.]|nr:hypothetical protein [Sphingomicrobium sp.]